MNRSTDAQLKELYKMKWIGLGPFLYRTDCFVPEYINKYICMPKDENVEIYFHSNYYSLCPSLSPIPPYAAVPVPCIFWIDRCLQSLFPHSHNPLSADHRIRISRGTIRDQTTSGPDHSPQIGVEDKSTLFPEGLSRRFQYSIEEELRCVWIQTRY